MNNRFTRRAAMQTIGAGAALLPLGSSASGQVLNAPAAPPPSALGPTTSTPEDRTRRLQWWHEARFGMFIHFGLYSTFGRHEWVMENEGIPVAEYEQAVKRFHPVPDAPRAWAKLAKRAGMKYMVMTTKHHEGFCHFDSKLTNYTAKTACGRDLVQEFVDAARAEGMRVGFYYSLMDWHHPDGAICATDESARRRFVDYIHGQVRELCSNYGKIDILWYDVNWPLTAEGWESVKMNAMVRKLQPEIAINNRAGIPEDFTTPEQRIQAYTEPWESCMTMNDSWGYQRADDNWKSSKNVVRNLIRCVRDNGNYLLNIGPEGDGSIPTESVDILTGVGNWMGTHAPLIHAPVDPCNVKRSQFADFIVRGNKLYVMVQFWPGSELAIGGMNTKAVGARLYGETTPVKFEQDEFRLRFTGLPQAAPDPYVSVLEVDFEGPPFQENMGVRKNRPRRMVGI